MKMPFGYHGRRGATKPAVDCDTTRDAFKLFRCTLLLCTAAMLHTSPVAAQEIGTAVSPLLGDVQIDESCSPGAQKFALKSAQYGRIAVSSDAFAQCIDERMRSKYGGCRGDPFNDGALPEQITKVVEAARRDTDVVMACTERNFFGNAQANIGAFDLGGPVTFLWSRWLEGQVGALPRTRTCTEAEKAINSPPWPDCRFAPYPWPYSQAAAIIWHEGLHQRGYGHGTNSQETAAAQCVPSNPSGWHFQENTVPYIVDQCLDKVLIESETTCGPINNCPFNNMLNLEESEGSRCRCSFDPLGSIAVLRIDEGGLSARHVAGGTAGRIGDWALGSENKIAGTGNFSGENGQILVQSGWGLGILEIDEDTRQSPVMLKNGDGAGGWALNPTDRILGTGDLTGDSRDEFLIQSGWGLGVIAVVDGRLTSPVLVPKGSGAGNWTINPDDRVEAVDNFLGSGADEVLMRSTWGSAIIGFSNATLTSFVTLRHGDAAGSWIHNPDDRIGGTGDLTGNGNADIVVTSGWGLAVLSTNGSGLASTVMAPNGTRIGDVLIDTRNADFDVVDVVDLNGDGREEIVVKTAGGIAILEVSGSGLRQTSSQARNTWVGGWTIDTVVQDMQVVGNIDGLDGDEILITSGWGIAVLGVEEGRLVQRAIHRNETPAGTWPVRSGDFFLGGNALSKDGPALIAFRR